MTDRERLLDELRPVAFAIAYRMLGSVAEAEDVVQEALLRMHQALDAGEQIASPRAFVATVTIRLAINELRSARGRRERYVGEWLPEPIITDGHDDPVRYAETSDSLSLAMLVLLERASRLSSEPCCCFTMCSTTGIRRLRRSLARARATCASSPPAPDATSSSVGPASKRRASSATALHDGSSRPLSKTSSSVLPRSDDVGEFGKDRWELIVRRVKGKNVAPGQGELFTAWRYHAFITGSTLQLAEAEKQHR
jgi:RNA polymerase sigma factor (sigma-70 family)